MSMDIVLYCEVFTSEEIFLSCFLTNEFNVTTYFIIVLMQETSKVWLVISKRDILGQLQEMSIKSFTITNIVLFPHIPFHILTASHVCVVMQT